MYDMPVFLNIPVRIKVDAIQSFFIDGPYLFHNLSFRAPFVAGEFPRPFARQIVDDERIAFASKHDVSSLERSGKGADNNQFWLNVADQSLL